MIEVLHGKKGTTYRARVYSPILQKKVSSRCFSSRKDAVKEEARMLSQIEAGELLSSSRVVPTLNEAAALWLTAVRSSYAEKTVMTHAYYYRHYVAPIFGGFRVSKVSSVQIVKFLSEIEKRPGFDVPAGKIALSPESKNKVINVLTLIFRFCRDTLRCIPVSPMDGIKRATVPHVKHVTWSPDQISAFLSSPVVKDHPLHAMLVLSFSTGMRPGEVCGLAESDLLPERILTISRGLNIAGHLTELKTARSHRSLALSEELFRILSDALAEKRKRAAAGILRKQNDFLFVGLYGAPILPNEYARQFAHLVELYNETAADPLPKITLYEARHSFATNLLTAGEKSVVVSEIMGNSIETMEHHYAHLNERIHAQALAGYADRILSHGPEFGPESEKKTPGAKNRNC